MTGSVDKVLESALTWLEGLGIEPRASIELAGDVSQRRYFRLDLPTRDQLSTQPTILPSSHARSAILAVYPAELADGCARFVSTTKLLTSVGVRVPQIALTDCDRGLMLIEDLGPATLYDLEGDWSTLGPYLDSAVDFIKRIQRIPATLVECLNPPLDGELLDREIRQTWEVFLSRPEIAAVGETKDLLRAALEKLCRALDDAPREICHRDYMARNLVPLSPPGALAVIDHQDLRTGPRGYDLASLLNDSLFASKRVEGEILGAHFPDQDDRLLYHRCAAQRCLKIVGTFVKSARHLSLVPLALERAADHLVMLPEAKSVSRSLLARWREPGFVSAQLGTVGCKDTSPE